MFILQSRWQGRENKGWKYMNNTAAYKNNGIITKNLFAGTLVFMILGIAVSTLGMMIDGVIIGNMLGVEHIAAYGLVTPLFSIFSALGNVFSTGNQAYVAKYLGKGETEKANRIFVMSFASVEIVAIILIVACVIFSDMIVGFLGAAGESAYLAEHVKGYLLGLIIGLPFIVGVSMLNPIMQLDGDRGRAFLSTIVMTVVNISLDLMNVYVFKLGMFGMAIATTISYLCAFITLLLHFKKKDTTLKLSRPGMDFQEIGSVVNLGLPSAISILCTTFRSFAINQILLSIAGSTAIAAFSVKNSLTSFLSSYSLGIGMTTLMMAGIVVGEEDETNTRHLMKTALKFAIVGTGLIALITFIFASPLAMLFLDAENADAFSMAVRCIRIHTISMPIYSLIYVIMNFMQGTKNVKMAHTVCILDNFVYIVTLAAILGFAFGTDGVWTAFPINEVIMCITLFVMVWIRNKKVPKKVIDFAFLPKNFGMEDEADVLEMSISDAADVMALSYEAENFCKKHNAKQRQTYFISLAIEEMAGNVIEYGFNDGKKHNLELRLVKKEEDYIIRIRDDCRAFNPLKQLELADKEDTTANIGIRMIAKMAKSFDYVSTMKVNNLIIRV